jgi:hypothetical protein
MNPKDELRLHRKIRHADRIIFWCMIGILLMVFVMFIGIFVQNQDNAQKSHNLANKNAQIARDQALQNHKRTQEYVKCVAQALTVPLTQRDNGALDQCTKKADLRTRDIH